MINPRLANTVALVTGANHGIGAATAVALAAQDARVFVTFFREPPPYSAEELQAARAAGVGGDALYRAMQQTDGYLVAERIRSQGGVAYALEADLFDARNITPLFDKCESELGPADVLVNNHTHCVAQTFDPALASDDGAGVRLPTAATIDAHFAVNARAVALMITEYVRRYLARGATRGRIVNVSTDAAHAHVANVSYAASKHAIESYSRSAAAELGKYGITVNVVAPGPTQTGYITTAVEAGIAPATPLRRVGMPDDVADVIVYLASDQARWLTGQLLYVGGGFRMHQ